VDEAQQQLEAIRSLCQPDRTDWAHIQTEGRKADGKAVTPCQS
jgi:hypothetical protein